MGQGRGQRVLRASIAGLLLIWLGSMGAVIEWERRDEARPVIAIVVMGAAQYVGHPSPVLRARLDHALFLWQRSLAREVILTGGEGMGDTTSEAAVGRRYMLQHGVPDSAIRLENQGRTTSESLHGVVRLMEHEADKSVILVSDPFHSLRLEIVARRLGLVPYTSPTRTSPISSSGSRWKYVLSESLKVPLTLLLERER
ncbi:MAG: YdcF family protein [Gemmatimonadaceae bacterium]